jgi:hypothetical protein
MGYSAAEGQESGDGTVGAKDTQYLAVRNSSGNEAGILFYNPTDSAVPIEEAEIETFSFYEDYNRKYDSSLKIMENLGIGSSSREFIDAFSNPSYVYDSDDREYLSWYDSSGRAISVTINTKTDKAEEISAQYLG